VDEEVAGRPRGPADAAILAAGIAILVLGVLTTLSEAFTSVADGLEWSGRVGPLSGKTIIATAAFFVSWAILAGAFRRRNPALRTVTVAAAVLVVLGLIGTFPTFFEAFAPEG
jgi:hypothetical protein